MTCRIKIKDHSDILHSANEAILHYLESSIDRSISVEQARSVMSNAWREHYGAEIVYDENVQPKYLDFKDEQHFIMFVLGIDQNGR